MCTSIRVCTTEYTHPHRKYLINCIAKLIIIKSIILYLLIIVKRSFRKTRLLERKDNMKHSIAALPNNTKGIF